MSKLWNKHSMVFNHEKMHSRWDHQDFTPLSSLPAENIFNRHRSYAADFKCLSELFLVPSVDQNNAEKVFNPFRTKKEEPLYCQASNKICRLTNDLGVESRVDDYAFIDEGKYELYQDAVDMTARDTETDGSTFRVHHEELRDVPPDETAQLHLERIHARLAPRNNQESFQQHHFIWTECKHWVLSLVEETDRYIQFELRQKGDQACITLYDEEAYFAICSLIDCSKSPRELVFQLSSISSLPVEADCLVVVQNLLLVLKSKKTKIRENSSCYQVP
jgi:hypothetical protein